MEREILRVDSMSKRSSLSLLIALVIFIVTVAAVPSGCYIASRTPTNGQWPVGVVIGAGGYHTGRQCGIRAVYKNKAGETRSLVVTAPNSSALRRFGDVENYTVNGVGWSEAHSNWRRGWFLVKVYYYDRY